jgi:HSP20 family protein
MAKGKTKEITKKEPSRVWAPLDEAERWFEDVFKRPFPIMPFLLSRWRMPEMEETVPSVDMFEEKKEVVIKAELPGMKKEDIEISLTDNTITLFGEKKKEETVAKKNYYRVERSQGSFKRSFRLPAEVKTDKAKANFKDGVLEIRLPKTEEAIKQKVKVTVN